MKQECEGCVFFHPLKEKGLGLCRGNPKAFDEMENTRTPEDLDYTWPNFRVKETETCGQWADRTGRVPKPKPRDQK